MPAPRRARLPLVTWSILVAALPASTGCDQPLEVTPPPDALVRVDAAATGDAAGPLDASALLDAGPATDAATDGPAAGDAAGDGAVDLALPDLAGTVVVRLLAGNLSSGTNQTWDSGEGMRILEGLHADVAMIQEFNYHTGSATDLRAFTDATCGTTCSYARGPSGQQIPNGIISRYPILASGDWTDPQVSNRDFVWAHIDLPGALDLWAVSVHLLTSSSTARQAEATALVQTLAQSVPAGDLIVVAGDFNTSVRSEPCMQTLGARLVTAAPFPVDQANNGNTNAPRTRPYDWVLASPELAQLEVPVSIGANHFAGGLVFDTRIYQPLADCAPALVTDSAATNMQHMAVVKDFAIPQ